MNVVETKEGLAVFDKRYRLTDRLTDIASMCNRVVKCGHTVVDKSNHRPVNRDLQPKMVEHYYHWNFVRSLGSFVIETQHLIRS